MAIKIIIKREVPGKREKELLPLLIQLRALATAQPGYISGETLRNMKDPEEYLVISTWKSVDNWEAWVSSIERAAIQDKIDRVLETETQYSIYLYE